MSLALAILVTAGFLLVAKQVGLLQRAREAGRRARRSLIVLRDPTLSDEAKERQLREASLHLFKLLAYILLGTGAALGAPLIAVWGLQLLGFGSVAGTLAVLTRLDFIVAASLVATFAYFVGHRVQSR